MGKGKYEKRWEGGNIKRVGKVKEEKGGKGER